MNTLSRYIAGKFWGPFVFILCIFAALIFLGDSIEKMRWVATYSAPVRIVLKYSFLTMPGWLVQVLPVCCLLSSLLVISDMITTGEWTACLAGGFSVRQIFRPLIICIAIVALFGFAAQELIVPDMSKRAMLVFHQRIKGQKEWRFNVQRDVTLRLDSERILFAKEVRADEGLMRGMFIDIYDAGWSITRQINAKRFVWDEAKRTWFFEDGYIRNFGKKGSVEEESFERIASDFSIPPDKISLGAIEAENLSIRELLKRIAFLEASGLTAYQEYTFLNAKLAAPFATVIMCLLGMPLSIALKRSSRILNIVSSIAIGFSFWWIVSMLSSAGESGMINPVLAGWLPVGIFAAVALAEFKILKI